MVCIATVNNISVIYRGYQFILVEETGENHRCSTNIGIVAACSLCCNATYTATIIDCFDTAIVCYKGTTDVKTFLSIRFKRMCTCSRNNTDEPVIGLDYRRWKKYNGGSVCSIATQTTCSYDETET
jgi:hypothetical protein